MISLTLKLYIKQAVLYFLLFLVPQMSVFAQEKTPHTIEQNSSKPKYQRFVLSIDGGVAYNLFNPDSDQPEPYKKHFSNLRKGVNYGAEGTYYVQEYLGLGVQYSRFYSDSKQSNINIEQLPNNIIYPSGSLNGQSKNTFINPFISVRAPLSSYKNNLVVNIGMGKVFYENSYDILLNKALIDRASGFNFIPNANENAYQESSKISSRPLGYMSKFIFHHKLSKNLCVGLSLSYFQGIIKKINFESNSLSINNGGFIIRQVKYNYELEAGKRVNISRINASLNVSCSF